MIIFYPNYLFRDCNDEIEHIEKRIENFKKKVPKDPAKYFAGIAFISFNTEKDKRLVIDANETTWKERLDSFFNDGKLKDIKEHHLTWD